MATEFKEIPIRPLVGLFDAQSPASDADLGSFSLVKNFSTRGTRKRCRRGGWERLFAESTSFNNQDLHDQLVSEQVYGTLFTTSSSGGGDLVGLSYPYFYPPYSNASYNYVTFATSAACIYYPRAGLTGTFDATHCFTSRWHLGWPYSYNKPFYDSCNSGSPNFYSYSYYYLDCPWTWPQQSGTGYYSGNASGVYSPYFSTVDSYCTQASSPMPGCNEAITHLTEVAAEGSGRKLIAATLSRIYALNESTGNWKVLAQGLGNAGYVSGQCGCNDVRFSSAVMGAYCLLTNNFNDPLLWYIGDDSSQTCEDAAKPIGDLAILGIAAAGGAVSWKGFMILFDLLENGVRHSGKLIWSDFENPTSWIPGDTSLAGEATVAPGERFLAAAELGNFLYLYSDRSIWRVTLLDSDVLFSFDKIYSGNAALKYRYSLINTGKEHLFLGQNHIYVMTLFDTRPIELDWLNKVSPVIYNGLNEDDAAFGSINELACDQVIGGWNEEFKEVWYSWPTGNNTCPNVSLVLNVQYSAADYVDHGFTAFKSYRPDNRPAIDAFLQEQGVCSQQEAISHYFREGLPCGSAKTVLTPLTPAEGFSSLPLWDVTVGSIDLIGTNANNVTLFDYVPGNGLYIDTAGVGARGTIRTKSNLTFTNGHTFELVIYAAGNQRTVATDILTVTAGAILASVATITNYLQPVTKYTFNFAGNGSSGKVSIGFTGGTQLATTNFGPLLMVAYVRDLNTGATLFYDDFDSTSPIVPSSLQPSATTCILNPTENLALPADPHSLCAKLANLTEDDFCRDCGVTTKFVMADATDLTLKQYADTHYYREFFAGGYLSSYCGYACDNHWYGCSGYDSVLQSSAQNFKTDAEKTVKRLSVEADAVPQTTPSPLSAYVGYSAQGSCVTWVRLTDQLMKCLSAYSLSNASAQGIRPDNRLHYPTFYRGHFLHWRLKISGVGGGACLSEVLQVVKGAELNTSR
jgi:hypothetical protein